MSLFKKLDEILTKVGDVLDGIEDLNKRMKKVERRLYDHILEEKEEKLLGPDVYPEEVSDTITIPNNPPKPRPYVAPESPHVVMYGVGVSDGPTWGNTSGYTVEVPKE